MATQASDTANSTASKRARGASPDDLAVVAQRAQAFTNASGVAIALSEGNADEIVCRARSGASAPEVGAALRVEGTFTGLCIQTGKELRCDDCETDTRVDTAAIRALGIRSMVVTPIREENRVVGVLAAFAPTPHAFTITHVAVLKTMADQISALLQKERRAREENPQVGSSAASAARYHGQTGGIAAPRKRSRRQAAPPAVVIKPSSSGPARRRAGPGESGAHQERAAGSGSVGNRRRKKKRSALMPRREQILARLIQWRRRTRSPGSRFMMMGVVAVLVIAAASTFAFLKMQKPRTAAPQQTQEAANVPPASLPPSGNAQPVSSNLKHSLLQLRQPVQCLSATKSSGETIGEGGCREEFAAGRKACCRGEDRRPSPRWAALGTSRIAKQNISASGPGCCAFV